jgi:TolB-like protein/DNA-binding winged helix-turn-helix (wHTH) protein
VIFLFDDFELDTKLLELRRSGSVVGIEPKVFGLILLLVTAVDRVVSKNEIIDRLWQGRAISDAALSTCIKAARRAIGDSGEAQRLIRTYPGRGLRFIGAVSMRATDPPNFPITAMTPPTMAEKDMRPFLDGSDKFHLPDEPSIAVLPFEVVGTHHDHLGFADGLARDITTRLGRSHWLFVIARGSSFQFQPGAVVEIGSALAVRYVLQGSVQFLNRRVRINVALIDAVRKMEIWSETLDRNSNDIFQIQNEITEAIAANVQVKIEQTERRRALLKPMASLDAWSAYHRGWWHMDRHSVSDYEQAEACFKLAIQLDPGAARAFAGLSAVHRQRAFLNLTHRRDDEVRRTLDLALQSLDLDRDDPQGHWAMGRALMLQDDVPAALAEFEIANSLNPSFAMSHYSVGFGRAMTGANDTSDEALSRALRLSPVDPMRFAMLATGAFNAVLRGDVDRAADLATLAAAQPHAHFHILAIAAVCNAKARRSTVAENFTRRLRTLCPAYAVADFFSVFPFRPRAAVEAWHEGFRSIGIS